MEYEGDSDTILFDCFVLRHINLIVHLMPNRVKESKSEKKFKGEVLGINDKDTNFNWCALNGLQKLVKRLKDLEIRGQVETISTTILLSSTRVLR